MEHLINIQNRLNAPKNQKNTFGGYNYRSAEDILEAVKPLLKDEKCALVLKDDLLMLGNPDNEKSQCRFYVKATATLFDEKGQEIASTSAYARESLIKKGMDDSQITGTASSYARKYALNGLFCIDDNKDADTDEYQKQTQESVDEYLKQIENCETEQEINNLFYRWSKKYPKGTKEYTVLTNKSFDCKKKIVGA